MTDRERVGEGLRAVRDGIRPAVVAAWESSYGADWLTRVSAEGRHQAAEASADDLGFLLDGMWNTWNAVFARRFGAPERNLVLELREESRRWTRKETFSGRDAAWVLDSCEQLLIAFAAERQVAAVRSLKGDASKQPVASVPAADAAPMPETGSEAKPMPQSAQPMAQPAKPMAQPVKPMPQPAKTMPQPVKSQLQSAQPMAQPAKPMPQPAKTMPQPAKTMPQPAQTGPGPGSVQPEGQSAAASQPQPAQLRSGHLAPYTAWPLAALPDPREADGSVLASHILSIVRAEGPITADRVFTLMVKASGQARVTSPVRHQLNRALFATHDIAIRDFRNPLTRWPQRVIRSAAAEEVVVRELGPRDLYEVPLDEIASLMNLLTRHPLNDPEHTKRKVLDAYSLQRLTSRASAYLEAALALIPH